MSKIGEDLAEIKKKLGEYVSKGREIGYHEVRREPVMAVTPDKSKIKPLRKMKSCGVHFMAVDCSTRTLKRARVQRHRDKDARCWRSIACLRTANPIRGSDKGHSLP